MILKVDTVVFGDDFLVSLDLLDFKDLSMGFFDLVLSSHNFPELGLGKSSVRSNDLDDGNGWFLLSLD